MKATQFSKENQPNHATRALRGKGKRTRMLEALANVMVDELGDKIEDPEEAERKLYEFMVMRAMNLRDPSSGTILKEVFDRLAPTDKATMPVIEFPFREDGTASEKIEDVQNAVAGGILPVDMGNTMVQMIVAGIKVFEVTELADRLARIEEMLNSRDD